MEAFEPAEEAVLELVATAAGHVLLDGLPVLAEAVDEGDEFEIVVDVPVVVGEGGTEVVVVVVLELLVVASCVGEEVLGKWTASCFQLCWP